MEKLYGEFVRCIIIRFTKASDIDRNSPRNLTTRKRRIFVRNFGIFHFQYGAKSLTKAIMEE